MDGACSTFGEEDIRTGSFVVKSIADRHLRRPRNIWWDNIKVNIREKIGKA
jgi:hypothetical protein